MNNKYKEMRIKLEKHLITELVSRDDVKIYTLERGHNKRILSFSPYAVNNNTNKYSSDRGKYASLSNMIHKLPSDRNAVENLILDLVPNKYSRFFHLFLKMIADYNSYVRYCNYYSIPLLKKQDYNTLHKLIIRWRVLSQDEHYSLTKQQKRKLKKLHKNTINKK